MKKVFFALVISISCLFGLVACVHTNHVHNYSTDWSTNSSEHWHECQNDDCNEKRIDVGKHIDSDINNKCDVCNCNIYYMGLKHSVVYIPEVPASCDADGTSAYFYCNDCDKWFSDPNGTKEITDHTSIVIPKGHNLTFVPAKDATCTENGNIDYYLCVCCFKFFSDGNSKNEITDKDSVVIYKSGHKMEDGICTLCGKSETENLNYTDKGDHYELSGIGTSTETDIIIPREHNGKPITAIKDFAFYGCSGLTSITIPDSVKSIGEWAFEGCTALTDVTIGKGVEYIDSYAFARCSKLTNVIFGNSVESIGWYSFVDCKALTSVIFPDSIAVISDSAFYDCTGLSDITIPDGIISIASNAFYNTKYYNTESNWEDNVLYIDNHLIKALNVVGDFSIKDGTTTIASHAFNGCSWLTSITIPDSVISISSFAFRGCNELTNVNMGNNVKYIGSNAFSLCRKLTSINIPDSVTSIVFDTFYGCSGLISVTIGNGVKDIGACAFYGCNSLTSITIGNNIESIGESAFAFCENLTIYCEAESQPESWDSNWNPSNCPVVWGYKADNE